MLQDPLSSRRQIPLTEAVHEFIASELGRARQNNDPDQIEAVILFAQGVRGVINNVLETRGDEFPTPDCLDKVQSQILSLPEADRIPGGRACLIEALRNFRARILGILPDEISVGPVDEFELKPEPGDEKGAERDFAAYLGFLSLGEDNNAEASAILAVKKSWSSDFLSKIGNHISKKNPEIAKEAFRKALACLRFNADSRGLYSKAKDLSDLSDSLYVLEDLDGARGGYLLAAEYTEDPDILFSLAIFLKKSFADAGQDAIRLYRKAAELTGDDSEKLTDIRDAIEAINPQAPEADEIHLRILWIPRVESAGPYPAPRVLNPHKTVILDSRDGEGILEGSIPPGSEGLKIVKDIMIRSGIDWKSATVSSYNAGARTFSIPFNSPGIYEVAVMYEAAEEEHEIRDSVVIRVIPESETPKISRPYIVSESKLKVPPGQRDVMAEVWFDTRAAMAYAEKAEISRDGGVTWEDFKEFSPKVIKQWIRAMPGEKVCVRAFDFENHASPPSNTIEIQTAKSESAGPAYAEAVHEDREHSGHSPVPSWSAPEVLNPHKLILTHGMEGLVIQGKVQNLFPGQQVVYCYEENSAENQVHMEENGLFMLPVSCGGAYRFSLKGQNTHTDIVTRVTVKDNRPPEEQKPPAPRINPGQECRAESRITGFIPFYTRGQQLFYINQGDTRPHWAGLPTESIDINGNFSLKLSQYEGTYLFVVRGIDGKDSDACRVEVLPSAAEEEFNSSESNPDIEFASEVPRPRGLFGRDIEDMEEKPKK